MNIKNQIFYLLYHHDNKVHRLELLKIVKKLKSFIFKKINNNKFFNH